MRRGFTLVELILYLAIVSVIFAALIPFAWNVIEGGTKSEVQQEVTTNAWFMMEKIKSKIRNARSVTVVPTELTITNADNSMTTISWVSNNLQLTEGTSTVNLNSADTTVTGLVFTNLQTTTTKQVQIVFTVNSNYNQARTEYRNNVTLESSAEVRSI